MVFELNGEHSAGFPPISNARRKPLTARRREPPPGWAAANPDLMLCLLYVDPHPGPALEELLACRTRR